MLKEEYYYTKVRPDLEGIAWERGRGDYVVDLDEIDYNHDDRDAPAPCSNPLCCHTWRNCRTFGNPAGDMGTLRRRRFQDRPHGRSPESDEVFAELVQEPNTGRLRAFDCPRGLAQRARRAEFRKWCRESRKNAKAVLESLGLAVVDGVRAGDAPVLW